MFLLDTCAISEELKDPVDPGLNDWLKVRSTASLYLSAVTLTEIVYGIERLPKGRHRTNLEVWFEQKLIPVTAGRIIPVDDAVGIRCGALLAERYAELADAMIAATALVHGLTLVTRNVKDFAFRGLAVFNPWSK